MPVFNERDLIIVPQRERLLCQNNAGGTETFVLESLLPETGYEVHISNLRLRNAEARIQPPRRYHPEVYR
jgi:hypothetical protein